MGARPFSKEVCRDGEPNQVFRFKKIPADGDGTTKVEGIVACAVTFDELRRLHFDWLRLIGDIRSGLASSGGCQNQSSALAASYRSHVMIPSTRHWLRSNSVNSI